MPARLTVQRRARTGALAAVAAAVTTLGLAACGSGSGSDDGSGSSAAAGDGSALAAVQEAGVLRVGTEGTYAPFSFHDSSTDELTGYDVDVITAVAEQLGVEPEFSETTWDSIFAGLEAGRYDVIANQVSITDERTAKYDFSEPYTVSTGVVVVPADDTEITSLDDVAGKTTAQSATSNWSKVATDAGATVESVEGFTQAIALLKQGRIDLTFNDNLAVLDYLKSTGDEDVKIAFETDDVVEQGFPVLKGSDLAPAIDDALEALRADGTLAEISTKWFGQDVSQ
ncbi:amino acid ABC transporter substrate-binding protein [Cellulomonas hominis]|uniref:amino acid ABC transporter substrate-binding protein n=1 Tax=Cellulomonas hominis TaxID=156981 RepID=UPI001B91D0E0|nr:amino acid ABC transporter substrate-binding protein [Cellulomonas hominis]VTR75986.1 L-cystine-binding protein TcyA [Cellulomonas hominis]